MSWLLLLNEDYYSLKYIFMKIKKWDCREFDLDTPSKISKYFIIDKL